MATSQCFENPPSLSSICGSGNLQAQYIYCIQEIGGLKTYVTGPQDSKLAILCISDVFVTAHLYFFINFCYFCVQFLKPKSGKTNKSNPKI
ncbi:hypothetical protein ACSBR1_015093 [Camellia fascicularis]